MKKENNQNKKEMCPKCGCQIYDPFGMNKKIHDINKCLSAWSIKSKK